MATVAPAAELAEALGDLKEEVTVKGKPRTVTPLRTRQFVEVLKAVDKLMEAGVVTIEPGAGIGEAFAQARKEFDPLKMVLRGGDQIIRIVSVGSGLSVSEVENLDLTDMVRLTAAVFKVNLDFFDRNGEALAAALGPLGETIKGLLGGGTIGEPSSPDSSEPATG